MKIKKLFLYLLLILILLFASCSSSKEINLPYMDTDSIEHLKIQGSGVSYRNTIITDRRIINSISDWYNNIYEISERHYSNTFIADPQLTFSLKSNEFIIIRADYQPSDILQVTHVISRRDVNKSSIQVTYRGKSQKLSQFIIKLQKLKKEKNNESPNTEEIFGIISDINSNNPVKQIK